MKAKGVALMYLFILAVATLFFCPLAVCASEDDVVISPVYSDDHVLDLFGAAQGLGSNLFLSVDDFDYVDGLEDQNEGVPFVVDISQSDVSLYIEYNPYSRATSTTSYNFYVPAGAAGTTVAHVTVGFNQTFSGSFKRGDILRAYLVGSGSLTMSSSATSGQYYINPRNRSDTSYAVTFSLGGLSQSYSTSYSASFTSPSIYCPVFNNAGMALSARFSFDVPIDYFNSTTAARNLPVSVSFSMPYAYIENTGYNLSEINSADFAQINSDLTHIKSDSAGIKSDLIDIKSSLAVLSSDSRLYDYFTGENFSVINASGATLSGFTYSGVFYYMLDHLYNIRSKMSQAVSDLSLVSSGLSDFYDYFSSPSWSAVLIDGTGSTTLTFRTLFYQITRGQYWMYQRVSQIYSLLGQANSNLTTQGSSIVKAVGDSTNTIIKGYGNSGMDSGSSSLGDSLSGVDNSLGVVVAGVDSSLADRADILNLFDFTAGLHSALTLVGSFESAFLTASGELTVAMTMVYWMIFLSIVVGLWRFFKR